MQLRFLARADLELAIDMPTAIEAVADAFVALSDGRAQVPLRTHMDVEGGVTLVMPAAVRWESSAGPDAAFKGEAPPSSNGEVTLGAKLVSVRPGNVARGEPVILALIVLLDAVSGHPLAVMDGTWLTALRTGAVSGVATRHLARAEARVLTVFGAGVQARTQVEAVRCVRDIEEVRVVSRSEESARVLAAELEALGVSARAMSDRASALAGADIVVAATDSSTPVFPGASVEPGTHVNGVGSFTPRMQEVDGSLIVRATVVVDEREAAWAEAGDLVIPLEAGAIDRDHVRAALGEVVSGRHPGRTDPHEVTYFKSVGHAVQDMAVASVALERANERDLGRLVDL